MSNRSASGPRKRISDAELEQIAPPYRALLPLVVFAQAFNTFGRAFEKAVQPAGLNLSQSITLWALLLSDQPLTPTEISRVLPIQTHSVTTLLDRLQDRKLIRRRRSTSDRRSVNVTLTAEGEQLAKQFIPAVSAVIEEVFLGLSTDELETLESICRKIRNSSTRRLDANPDHLELTVEQLTGPVARLSAETKK
ncbi:MAG: MarR family transcriptional regulator [Dehalococcoidia bacterium]|nr:MarR family transcriptional regulator [Dehalococcoidia bacterium]